MKSSKTILMDYFKSGEKASKKIGVEFEHFLVSKADLRSYEYFEKNGQKQLMHNLISLGWQVAYAEGDDVFNAVKAGNMVSFEPGGQVEISIKPFEHIADIEAEYLSVKKEIEGILSDDQSLISLGYHPKTKIETLPLLPKKRYEFMYDELHRRGKLARNMMKGTASTQVSIDYENEKDFIKKYRVANFLAPFIARLFDASPIFEGEIYTSKNLRVKIWDHTDVDRCKMPKGTMEGQFDYEAYCNYILNSEPILMIDDKDSYRTDHRTVADLDQEHRLSKEQLIHATTMVFPDIRVKHFLEIRVADALPWPHSLAVPALIKGIFYNEENLNKYFKWSLNLDDNVISKWNDHVKKSYAFELECLHLPQTCNAFIEGLIDDAAKGLSSDEKSILLRFKALIQNHESYSEYLKTIYLKDQTLFKEVIISGGEHVQF
ncbi:glutamate-cysteine ligase family protein [Fusibacter ferrireducens]|uniref:glutamate--cysteine ligase n=1 Tax=Fusibacter ferrireducens TaxID=2785058 RepID=A0ABR9ZQ96_9FIRM|nr:glutamate-cysteine ligase family protein [Fusibacter ferrireducens]MBF4692622.1 glutamate--cysteine ligase [Fusibacter ferrireducens]